MKSINALLLLTTLTVCVASAGLPEIGKLQENERLQVTVMYTEPLIMMYLYSFDARSVVIKENDKELGKVAITEEEASKIDKYLDLIRRGKRAQKGELGGPFYMIELHRAGKKTATYVDGITSPRHSSKPTISLHELLKRVRKR